MPALTFQSYNKHLGQYVRVSHYKLLFNMNIHYCLICELYYVMGNAHMKLFDPLSIYLQKEGYALRVIRIAFDFTRSELHGRASFPFGISFTPC